MDLQQISLKLQAGKARDVKALVQQAIDEGIPAHEILEKGLVAGMNVIGEKFKNNEVFVPEVLVAARAMNMGASLLKPLLAAEGVKATGKVCIGTVKGDLHDIGKNIVRALLQAAGFEVIDLGIDTPASAVVAAVRENDAHIVALSGVLTLALDAMKDTVDALEAAGLRDQVHVIIGGNPVSEDACKNCGADEWAHSPQKTIDTCKAWVA